VAIPNLEYGNFNRLLVSLGLLLVAGAGAGPYFLLRETSVLTISEAELKELTPVARATILDRQELLHDLPSYWPIPGLIAVLGLGLVSVGSSRLLRKQGQEDERDELENQRLRTQVLQEQSKDEIVAQSLDDAESILVAEASEPNEPEQAGHPSTPPRPSDPGALAARIRSTEEAVLSRLEASLEGRAEVVPRVKIRGVSEQYVDALIRFDSEQRDVLVQVKLLTTINTARIRESIQQTSGIVASYKAEYPDRAVLGLVVLVLEAQAYSPARKAAVLDRVQSMRDRVPANEVRVEVVAVDELASWSPQDGSGS
jgi:hypothetical protein